jgi:maltose alpha-D-glucosyltransferase/alpha-amylase
MQHSTSETDSLWFKNAIIYEVPVRAFADSNRDGIGDFRGLTEKLDYLQDLGITAVWLLPFFPSPLRDDGYDISDYLSINPIYGNLDDFKAFLDAAHQRDIRVIIELIVNHTSDQHEWFQRSRRAPQGSVERDFYVWSDTPEKYQDARIIFKDFETSNWAWDAVAKSYYWHRFYSHQPDLNYDNPAVREAVLGVLEFWLNLGVDGFRLDAVPYLYEREGTNCENLPQTHQFLKDLRAYIDRHFPNRMLLAEANQWPEDAAAYYGNGDECHMNFHFPLMPRLFMALRQEDSFPIMDILEQTPPIPANCQWGLFLRNHDELTLEMVTDEDRDYMYRVYAQDPEMRVNLGIRRRLAPLLGNDRRQIELLHALLLSLPGTPVLYYGDEIGMGDNVYVGDRNGVRTPMQWSADRNAGFSQANPQRLYLPLIVESEYHHAVVNVEVQQANVNSLWYAIKRLITTRKRFRALGQGSFQFLHPENRKVLAFIRSDEDEQILVLANLSRFVQVVDLNLREFSGRIPVEIFGRTEFPPIGETPYFLSVGPYAFYWFILKPQPSSTQPAKSKIELPALAIGHQWQRLFAQPQLKTSLEAILPEYLYTCSWFRGKHRTVQAVHIVEVVPIPYHPTMTYAPAGESDQPSASDRPFHTSFSPDAAAQLVWLQVDYVEGESQSYLLPLAYMLGEQLDRQTELLPGAIARGLNGILFEATTGKEIWMALLEAIATHHSYRGTAGTLSATPTAWLSQLLQDGVKLEPALAKDDELHTFVVYGDRLILKMLRCVEPGINPDLEMRQFLSQHQTLLHVAPLGGVMEYRSPTKSMTVGIAQEYVPDARNSWNYTLDSLRDFFEKVIFQQAIADPAPAIPQVNLEMLPDEIPEVATQTIGTYLANARLLGTYTADLHLVLACDHHSPDFAPEPFSLFYQRSVYQYARNLIGQTLLRLKQRLKSLPAELQPLAQAVLDRHDSMMTALQPLLHAKIDALRTRYHGNYHLQRLLYTGKDFIITDFEGDFSRSLSEGRMKRSPLRDVVAMVESFYAAAYTALSTEVENGMIRPENLEHMEQWAQFWCYQVSQVFLQSYLTSMGDRAILPKQPQSLQILFDVYLLERMIHNLSYALNYYPDQLEIRLKRILTM